MSDMNPSLEEFEALLNESFEMDTPKEGTVVKGKVIAIEAGQAIIDVGYKMEGRVDIKEFANPGEDAEIAVGDEVEVFLRQVENARGEAVISREMARREEAWDRLEKAYADEERVEGAIFGRVKGKLPQPLGRYGAGGADFLQRQLRILGNIGFRHKSGQPKDCRPISGMANPGKGQRAVQRGAQPGELERRGAHQVQKLRSGNHRPQDRKSVV